MVLMMIVMLNVIDMWTWQSGTQETLYHGSSVTSTAAAGQRLGTSEGPAAASTLCVTTDSATERS